MSQQQENKGNLALSDIIKSDSKKAIQMLHKSLSFLWHCPETGICKYCHVAFIIICCRKGNLLLLKRYEKKLN
jgi:hypothetical protein